MGYAPKRLKLQHLNLGFRVSEFKCLSLELRLQIYHRRKVEKFVRFSELTMRRVEFNQGDGFDNPGFFFFKTELSALHLQLLLQLFNLNTVKDFYSPTN